MKEHVETAYHPCKSRLIGFNCQHCKHTSWTEDQLNDHVMCMHAEIIRNDFILCICCAASLNSMDALRSHMQRHHPMDFQDGEKFLFQCEICRINFSLMVDIRKHMKKVFSNNISKNRQKLVIKFHRNIYVGTSGFARLVLSIRWLRSIS